MTNGVNTIVYPVTDLTAAKALFSTLIGAEPEWEQPGYVGWQLGGQDIGIVPDGPRKGITGPTPYWHVTDLAASLKELVEAGATVTAEPRNIGKVRRVATVTVDGNAIGLLQTLEAS